MAGDAGGDSGSSPPTPSSVIIGTLDGIILAGVVICDANESISDSFSHYTSSRFVMVCRSWSNNNANNNNSVTDVIDICLLR